MLHSQREQKTNQGSSLRVHVSKFGRVHYPINWEHPLSDGGAGILQLSGKGQKATIALLYCFHTFSSKLPNYHQSKAAQDETDKQKFQLISPCCLLSSDWCASSFCRGVTDRSTPHSHHRAWGGPAQCNKLQALHCVPDKASRASPRDLSHLPGSHQEHLLCFPAVLLTSC